MISDYKTEARLYENIKHMVIIRFTDLPHKFHGKMKVVA